MSTAAEVKILLRVHYQILAAIFNKLTEVRGFYPFSRSILRGALVHSNFDLNFTTCIIIEIKT